MPDTIKPETLPDWPYKNLGAEEVTLLSDLLGKHDTRPLTGVFGHVMLLWEALRHDEKLIELLAKQRNDPIYSTLFEAQLGFITSMAEFPNTPFLGLEAERKNELVELFTPGRPAIEIGNIEMLDAMGVLEKFKQLVTLSKEGRQHREPGTRFKQLAIVKFEKLSPGESVYAAIVIARTHLGIKAARRATDQVLKDNSKLFQKIDTLITAQNWQDPRPILSDLAVSGDLEGH